MRNIFKALFIAMIISLPIIRPALSYADWHDHGGDRNDHDGDERDHDRWHGHDCDRDHHHHYHSYVGFNFSIWSNNYYYGAPYYPPADVVLVSPPLYQPVDVNGFTYYLKDGTYYLYNGFDYQAVAPPVTVVQQPVTVIQPPVVVDSQLLPADSFTINIPNDGDGYTAVTLKQSGNGYIGPQGEFYSEFPTVSQLRVVYGR